MPKQRVKWTTAKINALVKRIDFSRFPIAVSLRVKGGSLSTEVIFRFKANHTKTGKRIFVNYDTVLQMRELDEEHFLGEIYYHLKKFIEHEISECFLVNGKRKFNDGLHP